LPGALPIANREAVRLAVRAALALDFNVHVRSWFARKHYFYPDLPKGYQISQFDRPLATGGRLEILSPDRGSVAVGITRLHLEEDAGKSVHDRFVGKTAIDFNRSGIPLVEIVSEPDLRSPAETRAYLGVLKQLLQYVDVSDCSMEAGRLRVDANLSVRRVGERELGVKQEVKNMNSFAAVERALEQLRDAQIEGLQRGERIELATFSAATGELRRMRGKEESHDYRYFPEPDLPPLCIDETWLAKERDALPELPAALRRRLHEQYGIRAYDAEVLAGTRELAQYYESVTAAGAEARAAAHWVMGSVLQDLKESNGVFRVGPARLATLIGLVTDGTLSNQAAKHVFSELTTCDDEPHAVADRMALLQVADEDQLSQWIDTVLERYPDEVAKWRGGESKLMGFLMGRVMKESGGKADPRRVQGLLEKRLR
jgi:aspartyl-tRNA(Asn)/glutamyl-tRNA(Gln) amidotransferase subunit B